MHHVSRKVVLVLMMEIVGHALQPVSVNLPRIPPMTTRASEIKVYASTKAEGNDEAVKKKKKQNRVCVVGSTNIDLITSKGPRFPRAGETITFDNFEQCFGGKGANQAVQAARCGACTKMIAKVGDDNFGASMIDNFKESHINTDGVTIAKGAPSGCALITVAENTNTIVIVPGANAQLLPRDIHLEETDILLCQMEVPVDTSVEAMHQNVKGINIVNTAPVPSDGIIPKPFLQAANIVCANEVELELMTTIPATDISSAARAAQALILKDSLPGVVVATLGSKGALIVGSRGPVIHVPPLTGITVVDTTGAGDSFLGALGAFLAQNFPLVLAVFLANLVAALAVQRPTTQPSYPTVHELAATYPTFFSSSTSDDTILTFIGKDHAAIDDNDNNDAFSLDMIDFIASSSTHDSFFTEETKGEAPSPTIMRLNSDGSLSPVDSAELSSSDR